MKTFCNGHIPHPNFEITMGGKEHLPISQDGSNFTSISLDVSYLGAVGLLPCMDSAVAPMHGFGKSLSQ